MISEELEGEASLSQDFDALSVSKRLVRSVSQKLKKKNRRHEVEEDDDARGVTLRCLVLYGRGGGCKVGADTSDEGGDSSRRRSIASEEGRGYNPFCGVEETGVDCFSSGVKDRLWRRNNRKYIEFAESPQNSRIHVFLPDDILEMCLVRLPLTSLMTARLVCRKWRYLTTTPRFLQIRREGFYQSPWLFLFGAVKDGYCSGEIHAYDFSLDKWHRTNADILKGRYLFSVTSIRGEVYTVGGCSSLANSGRVDRSSFRTHKSVFKFCPLNKSWRKVASMKYARSTPLVGSCEVTSDCLIFRGQQNWQDRRAYRTRLGGASDVYEDPHRLSVRRQLTNSLDESEVMVMNNRKASKLGKQKNDKGCKRFVLIVFGGLGSWDEPLDSGEMYDSASNKWIEIQRLPLDFGIACAGVICNGMFYVYSETDKLAGYDIVRGLWTGIQTTPSPPRVHEYHPKLVSCNGRLFMLCVSWCEGDGEIGRRNKAIRKLWELDLIHRTWSEISIHPDAPMDWNAVFVADGNLIFGVEMFKIFGQVLDFFTLCDVSKTGTNWRHVSRSHMGHELDASSCMTKSVAVLHL